MPRHQNPTHTDAILLKLRHTRKLQGLTTAALAKRVGVIPSQLSNWEMGKQCPSKNNLTAWANALGFDIVLREME